MNEVQRELDANENWRFTLGLLEKAGEGIEEMMNEADKQTVRELLEACRALGVITNGLEAIGIVAESINYVHELITNIIWRLYDIALAEDECSDNFMTIIIDYGNGEFEIDECLKYLAQFTESAR